MRNIRKGNDIIHHWSILAKSGDTSVPYDLMGKNLTLLLAIGARETRVMDFSISANVLTFPYYGKDQDRTGNVTLTLIENEGLLDMHTLDKVDAYRLVAHSNEVGGEDTCSHLNMEVVNLASTLEGEIGPRGYSAYEIAVQEGFVGTEEEWLESLKGEQGEQGEQGIEGPQGEKGDKGDRGEQGPQGEPGSDAEVTQQNIERALGYVPADDGAVVKNCPDAAIFGEKGVALGSSSTKATERGITENTSKEDIIEEWENSDPETDKFALVKGKNAIEAGNNNLALGDNSMAVGNGNITGDKSAVAFGTGCRALKKYSSSKGLETTSLGQASSSEGQKTISSGKASHSEGRVKPGYETFQDSIKSAATESKLYQTLDGDSAADLYEVGYKLWKLSDDGGSTWEDVLNQNITVTAVYTGGSKWFQLSKKLGIGNKATRLAIFISNEEYYNPKYAAAGDASHTEGVNTRTQNEAEHAEGAFNKSNTGNSADQRTRHSIGIGSEGDEQNAVEVMENGDVYIKGLGGYNGKNPALAQHLVQVLANYYLKSETYTKAEVQALIGAIHSFHYEIAASTSAVTDPQTNALYLIGPTGSGSDKYEEYVYTTDWVKIGDTSIDLSGYARTGDLASVAFSGSYNDLTDKPTNPTEVFWATYGVTTYQEVADAVNAGKLVICVNANSCAIISSISPSAAYFYRMLANWLYVIQVTPDNSWRSARTYSPQDTANLVTAFGNNPSDSKYPSEKLVYDSLYKRGVISQTQTWTQAADGGYDYVMSDLVYGDIPRANIDLFVAAGAVFNETSGYFELNGLTDISYEEMKAIYNGYMPNPWNNQQMMFSIKTRTNLPPAINTPAAQPMDGLRLCYESGLNFSVLTFSNVVVKFKILQLAFFNNFHLSKVIGTIDVLELTNINQCFQNCYTLESIYLRSLKISVNIADSPRLSNASILYMINNEAATSAITITLHATAYARATADADITAALANHPNVTLASA